MFEIRVRDLVEGRVYHLESGDESVYNHPGDEDTVTILSVRAKLNGNMDVTYRLEYWSANDGQSVSHIHRTRMHRSQKTGWTWKPRPDEIPL